MKDSGIEWIGKIPDDWEIKSIKQLLIERTEKNTLHQTNTVLSLSAKDGVTLYDGEHHAGNRPREDLSDYKVVYPNDIVVNSMNILSGSVGLSRYKGCVSPVYYIYYPRINNNVEFMHYIFQCKQFQLSLRGLGNGILIKETENGNLNTIRMRIPAQKLGMQQFPWCDSNKQQKIADCLNKKCVAVDRLIENQKEQIDKLKEYKQSFISEAVTKGLDSTVPMKDSGVEWINNIAMSHNIVRLKFLLKENMLYGANESGENTCVEGVRYIRITDITADGKLKNDENNQYLKREIAKNYMLSDKDILFARSGGTVGKTFMYRASLGDSSFAGYLIKATCNSDKLLPEYLMYYTQSSLYMLWKSMIFIQATIQNIGANKYSNMEVVLPNIEGQQQIADYLDKKCAEIDNLISIKQQKIEKLQEYKKSLIYEYVTGKKQVLI